MWLVRGGLGVPRRRSTKDPGQKPFTYRAGVGGVIKGWDQGCLGMARGEVRLLIIPAAEGYGDRGFPSWGIPVTTSSPPPTPFPAAGATRFSRRITGFAHADLSSPVRHHHHHSPNLRPKPNNPAVLRATYVLPAAVVLHVVLHVARRRRPRSSSRSKCSRSRRQYTAQYTGYGCPRVHGEGARVM